MTVFPLADVVAAPVPGVPPTGLPSASQHTATPAVNATAALTTSKIPTTASAPGVLAAIGVLATPTKSLWTTTCPAATAPPGV